MAESDQPIAGPIDLPRGIGNPALRALALVGVTHLEQVCAWSDADLLALHGVGPKAVWVLRAALVEQGLAFTDERAGT